MRGIIFPGCFALLQPNRYDIPSDSIFLGAMTSSPLFLVISLRGSRSRLGLGGRPGLQPKIPVLAGVPHRMCAGACLVAVAGIR